MKSRSTTKIAIVFLFYTTIRLFNLISNQSVLIRSPLSVKCINKSALGQLHFKSHHSKLTAQKGFSSKWMPHLDYYGLSYNPPICKYSPTSIEPVFPQFITAITDGHFMETLAQIPILDKLLKNRPHDKLIIYDLGLRTANLKILQKKFAHRTIVRRFPFEKFPYYFRKIIHFRWKPLIIAECFHEFPAIFWIDSSVHFNISYSIEPIIEWSSKSVHGFTSITMSSHSVYATTHHSMYKYFPYPRQKAKEIVMIEAGNFVSYRSCAFEKILTWWVLCALERDCFAPYGSQPICTFDKSYLLCNRHKKDTCFTVFANCHRFDQSAINMILGIESYFDVEKYYFPGDHIISHHKIAAPDLL